MNVLDLVFLGFVGLFALIGIFRGMFKPLLQLVGFAGSLFLGLLVAKFAVNYIFGIDFLAGLINKVSTGLLGKFAPFTAAVSAASLEADLLALLPSYLAKPIAEAAIASYAGEAMTFAELVGPVLMRYLVTLLVTILCYSVIHAIVTLILNIFKNIKFPKVPIFSQILGFVVNAARGALVFFLLLSIGSFFLTSGIIPAVTELYEASAIVRQVDNINIVGRLLVSNIDVPTIIQNAIAAVAAA